ncbi:MAG: type VI secretion system baseplate subunit TssG [Methylococcaceae bacterium]|nr:type VI secretion system baseplate subunit TssG [Methylococcaceae bacterium]
MDDKKRNKTYFIDKSLLEKPYEFGFFQAIRLIECKNPQKPLLGRGVRPYDDPIRLDQDVSLSFAPSTITAYQYRDGYTVPHLSTAFFGLFGPNGALPTHLTEYAFQRLNHHQDPTFIRFINLFQHRMLSLFYRAWANAQPTVNFDRPDEDRFKVYVGSLLGIAIEANQKRDDITDLLKLHYSGHFSCQAKHAEGLAAIIHGYFGLIVEIEEFVGEWLDLPDDSVCRLGDSEQTGLLGTTAILGSRIWSRQNKFRITLGPMGIDQYQQMLPGGGNLKRLISIVKNYIGIELGWDIQLILKKNEVPKACLDNNSQLGWTTWIGERTSQLDADDLILNPIK